MFKKMISIIVAISFVFCFMGCGDTKKIDGKVYDTYGLLNEPSDMNENIQYRLIIGNLVWGILLIETIVFPIYFFGFSLYEPVGLKTDGSNKGVIGHTPNQTVEQVKTVADLYQDSNTKY